MLWPAMACGKAATQASATVMSAATTLNCTSAAMLQQHEGAPGVAQGVPATVMILVGTTGEASGAKPNAEAAHLAKLAAETTAASTSHSCTWL